MIHQLLNIPVAEEFCLFYYRQYNQWWWAVSRI